MLLTHLYMYVMLRLYNLVSCTVHVRNCVAAMINEVERGKLPTCIVSLPSLLLASYRLQSMTVLAT